MIFLRFADEAQFTLAMSAHYLGNGQYDVPDLDVIGLIYEGGEWGEDGEVIVPATQLEGYHANASSVPVDLQQFVIDRPNSPFRIFAGTK